MESGIFNYAARSHVGYFYFINVGVVFVAMAVTLVEGVTGPGVGFVGATVTFGLRIVPVHCFVLLRDV